MKANRVASFLLTDAPFSYLQSTVYYNLNVT
jgi:hypothetical protein